MQTNNVPVAAHTVDHNILNMNTTVQYIMRLQCVVLYYAHHHLLVIKMQTNVPVTGDHNIRTVQ